MIFYHATPKENIFSIMKEGIKIGWDGCIYLCKSPTDCLLFFISNPLNKGKRFAVIPIDLDPEQVKESYDHNKEFIKCDAYFYDKPIPAEKIPKNLDDILLYKL